MSKELWHNRRVRRCQTSDTSGCSREDASSTSNGKLAFRHTEVRSESLEGQATVGKLDGVVTVAPVGRLGCQKDTVPMAVALSNSILIDPATVGP